MEHFSYKSEWAMCIDTFKRKLGFSFVVIRLAYVANSNDLWQSDCTINKSTRPKIPYSGYNLRGAISASHQISHLEVIFVIIKFANHSMLLRDQINLRA